VSFDALAWAAKAKGIRPAEKLVLLGLAECASRDDGLAFPSIAALIEFSGLNRKTVIGALSALVERRLIAETGDTVGKTAQIKVYRLIMETVPKTGQLDSTENGTLSGKQSQKRDTDTVKELVTSEAKASSAKRAKVSADDFPMPEWADAQVWSDFLLNRKRKKLPSSATAHKGFLEDIARIATDEWPPGRLLRHAAAKGWGGIYEPDEMKNGHLGRNNGPAPAPRAGTQSGSVTERAMQRAAERLGIEGPRFGSQACPAVAIPDDDRTRSLPHARRALGDDGRRPGQLAYGGSG
jgi:hypothetical protein